MRAEFSASFVAGDTSAPNLEITTGPDVIAPSILAWNDYGTNPKHRQDAPITISGKPNTPFRIWIEPDFQSGGHTHGRNRPHGWLLPAAKADFPPYGAEKPVGETAYSFYATALPAQVGADGKKQLYYVAPGVGGSETLVVSSTEADSAQPTVARKEIVVRIPNLLPLSARSNPALPSYGINPLHRVNDYGTVTMLNSLEQAVYAYQRAQSTDPGPTGLPQLIQKLVAKAGPKATGGYDFPLHPASGKDRGGDAKLTHLPLEPDKIFVNDISLESGGIFDVAGNWSGKKPTGHAGHQGGRHVDIKTKHLVKGDPYTPPAKRGVQRIKTAPLSRMVGDLRLEKGREPFRNTDTFLKGGKTLHYAGKIRKEMNALVKQIQLRRLTLLIQALQHPVTSTTGIFAKEDDHIHVQYEGP